MSAPLTDKRIEILELAEKNAWQLLIVRNQLVMIASQRCGKDPVEAQEYYQAAMKLLDDQMIALVEQNLYRVTQAGQDCLHAFRNPQNVEGGQDEITRTLLNGLSSHPSVRSDWTRQQLIKFCMDSVRTTAERCEVALQMLTASDAARAADETAAANKELVDATKKMVIANKQMVEETRWMVRATAVMAAFTLLMCLATLAVPFISKWLDDRAPVRASAVHIDSRLLEPLRTRARSAF